MATCTVNSKLRSAQACAVFAGLLLATAAFATPSDSALTMTPSTSLANAAATATGQTAQAFGVLVETYATIVGLWYAFKSFYIYSTVAGGKAQPNQTMGSATSHFVAGVLAYNSDEFFQFVHNTIPMVPDFGRLVYDAELMLSLMS